MQEDSIRYLNISLNIYYAFGNSVKKMIKICYNLPMSQQESIRPDQQLALVFRNDVSPKTIVSTALKVRSLYAHGLSADTRKQVQEDETGLTMRKLQRLEFKDKVEAGAQIIFTTPTDANPEILNEIREMYSKKKS